jgi:hypothetical protein
MRTAQRTPRHDLEVRIAGCQSFATFTGKKRAEAMARFGAFRHIIPRFHPCGDRLATTFCMKQKTLTLPEIILIAGTRVALGAGIGFLISDKLNKDQRRGAGWALLGVGIVTSVPLVLGVIGKPAAPEKQLALAS